MTPPSPQNMSLLLMAPAAMLKAAAIMHKAALFMLKALQCDVLHLQSINLNLDLRFVLKREADGAYQ